MLRSLLAVCLVTGALLILPGAAHAIPPMVYADWTANGAGIDSWFGGSVASAGDVNGDGYDDVVVGAGASGLHGQVFLYYGSASGLSLGPGTILDDPNGSLFGTAVAGAGDVNGDGFDDVIVGDYGYTNGESVEGRVSIFLGSAAGLALSPVWTYESNTGQGQLGRTVACAGDVNGDGDSDVIVGVNIGRQALVFLGGPSGPPSQPAAILGLNAGGAQLGHPVAGAGDVNGDGLDDVIVGDYPSGRANLYLSTTLGIPDVPSWTGQGTAGERYGWSVAGAGDVNGDGYADIVVSADRATVSQTWDGKAYLYLGGPGGPALSPAWTVSGGQAFDSFGSSVARAGDINGDGYSDVAIGARDYSNGETYEGRSFTYYGGPGGLALTPAWTAESDQASASFGASVATANDVNGDGFDDVIVGAINYNSVASNDGKAFAYYGPDGGQLVGVGDRTGEPLALTIRSAAPNPFRDRIAFHFALPARGPVRLSVHDVEGRVVAALAEGEMEAGPHTAHWDGLDRRRVGVASGVYIVRLEFAGQVQSARIVRTR